MGIRIKKMLGYGLLDVQCKENGKITDPRFNEDSVLFADYTETDRFNREHYLAYCKKHNNGFEFDLMLELDWLKTKGNHWDWYDSFRHDSEYGLPKVLCIRPASCPDWYQYDNTIDYYQAHIESRKSRKYMNCTAEEIEGGIYPFIADYHDKRDGRTVDSSAACAFLRLINTNRDLMKRRGKKKRKPLDATPLARLCGFKNTDEALENMYAKPPDTIVNLCRFGEIFKDEATIRELVPMLYTYWS